MPEDNGESNALSLTMDAAATVAREEFRKLDSKAVKVVADWWLAHCNKTGHKRLAHVLLGRKISKSMD